MVDLEQFRGKRALVCGIPRDGAKTQQAWLDATDKAMRGLGLEGATEARRHRNVHSFVMEAQYKGASVVLVVPGYRYFEVTRLGAKRAGIPVLRVRRDGSVEVDNA